MGILSCGAVVRVWQNAFLRLSYIFPAARALIVSSTP